jgi:hypothetical protein
MVTIIEKRAVTGDRRKLSTVIDAVWTSRDAQTVLRVMEAGVSEEDLPEIRLHLTIQEVAERLGISVESACALVKVALEARGEVG